MERAAQGTRAERHVVLSDGAPPGREHHEPAIAVAADSETTWAVWQAYGEGREQILARARDAGGRLGHLEAVTLEPGWHTSPQVGMLADRPVAVWLRGGENSPYQVVSAARGAQGWEQAEPVSRGSGTVLHLRVDAAGERMQAVWCQVEAPAAYAIWTARFDGHAWHEPVRVTPAAAWVQRPEVALAPSGCWIVWDAYDGRRFEVWSASVPASSEALAAERVSPVPEPEGLVTPEAWQFIPSVAVDAAGVPWAAWLCLQDVATDGGVVDQWPVGRVAYRAADGWRLLRDAGGSADLAQMAWGLLPHQGHGVWGYLGRRRNPLVRADPERGAWLLWERKELHDGRTPIARGVLCARRLDAAAARIGPTRAVVTGQRYYVPGPIRLRDGGRRLQAVCRAHPDVSYTDVELIECRLDEAPLLDQEEHWDDWRPISVAAQAAPVGAHRSKAAGGEQTDGKTFPLYWADLHVHTTLSADAEGEVDEIIAYARDKARLDCVAISDNDISHLSLTASDWERYRHYVRHFDASIGSGGRMSPGGNRGDGSVGMGGGAGSARRFVLLPAYEWTYRPAPRAAPNHRMVIGLDERRLPILRCSEAGDDPMGALAAHAARHDLLLNVHHERWELAAQPSEANFEVCSGWGSHMANPDHRRRYHDALEQGRRGSPRHRLGFIGNSDNHRRNPGLGGALTGIYATELTREALLEALRARRCFATDGSRIAIRFWVNGAFMGQETTAAGAPRIRWEVAAPTPQATVRLVRDGETVREWPMHGETMGTDHVDDSCESGDHYYYLAVELHTPWREHPSNVAVARGPHAWTSPIWVRTHRRSEAQGLAGDMEV
jgi:hypothetical protein